MTRAIPRPAKNWLVQKLHAWTQGKNVDARARTARAEAARRLYGQWVENGTLCFDIGANEGERSRILLSLGGRVVAVEPQPDCVAMLRRIRRLIVEPVAVGAEPGEAELRLTTATVLASMADGWIEQVRRSGRFGELEWTRNITVPVTTLDALVDRYGVPGFCKIDIEGYEAEAIAGLSIPIPVLSFEFAGEWPEGTAAVVTRLRELGPYRFNLSVGHADELLWRDWRPADALLEHIASFDPSSLPWGNAYARIGD